MISCGLGQCLDSAIWCLEDYPVTKITASHGKAKREMAKQESGSFTLTPASSLVHRNSTAVLVASSTMTFTGWMFPNVSSSNCAWLYKYLHGLAPKYLAELCVPVVDVAGHHQLRSASRGLLNFPRYMANCGRCVFCFAGPYIWDSLPEYIRQSASIAVFKRSLKTFLLQRISHLVH